MIHRKKIVFLEIALLYVALQAAVCNASSLCPQIEAKIGRDIAESSKNPTKISTILRRMDKTAEALVPEGKLLDPIAWRRASAKYGLSAVDLPSEFGGADLANTKLVDIFYHAGEYGLDLRDVVGAGHARALLRSKEPEVREIVQQVAKGKGYVAISITEPSFGSNHRGMKSVSEKVSGGYVLTGEKMYNARFRTASHVVLFTQSSSKPEEAGKLNAFVLPINYPGLKFSDLEAHGLKGNSFGGVSFNELFVPDKFRIGEEGEANEIFRDHFLYWRLMQTAAAIGTAQGALDQVVWRLREREAFGGPIGRFTHKQQALAEHTAKLYMARLLVKDAAKKLDRGELDEAYALIAMAKAEGVEYALKAADFAMETFGAEGYSTKVDLGQRVDDLKGLRIADGTTDVLRQEVVSEFYGRDFRQMAIGPQLPHTESRGPVRDADAALTQLQNRNKRNRSTLALEDAFNSFIVPGGGGACAPANAFNSLQALRLIGGFTEPLNARSTLEKAYKEQPTLRKGRVSNSELRALLESFQEYLPGKKIDIQMDVFPGHEKKPLADPQSINRNYKEADLDPKPGTVKTIIFDMIEDGTWISRHFVTLKRREGNKLIVVDPTDPSKEYIYTIGTSEGKTVFYSGRDKWQRVLNTVVSMQLQSDSPQGDRIEATSE